MKNWIFLIWQIKVFWKLKYCYSVFSTLFTTNKCFIKQYLGVVMCYVSASYYSEKTGMYNKVVVQIEVQFSIVEISMKLIFNIFLPKDCQSLLNFFFKIPNNYKTKILIILNQLICHITFHKLTHFFASSAWKLIRLLKIEVKST